MSGIARALALQAGRVPLLRGLLAHAYRRHFARATGSRRLFDGIYPDFATAANAAPRGKSIGHDSPASARRLAGDAPALTLSDYPVLFWLRPLLRPGLRIFDWGGNLGLSYFAYRRQLDFPDGLSWMVNDVPAVVRLGREIATADAPGLAFTTELGGLAEADVLIAAGSLHFMADPWSPLERAARRPPHVIINKLPVYDRPAAVTLQNTGAAFVPNHLFNRRDVLGRFARLGYRLADAWTIPGHGCDIPFHPEQSIAAYSGFYWVADH